MKTNRASKGHSSLLSKNRKKNRKRKLLTKAIVSVTHLCSYGFDATSMRAFKTCLRPSFNGFWQMRREVARASSHCPNKTWLKKHCSWCFWDDPSSCSIRRESDAAAVLLCSILTLFALEARDQLINAFNMFVYNLCWCRESLFTCGGRHLGKSCAINTLKLWPLSCPIKHEVVFWLGGESEWSFQVAASLKLPKQHELRVHFSQIFQHSRERWLIAGINETHLQFFLLIQCPFDITTLPKPLLRQLFDKPEHVSICDMSCLLNLHGCAVPWASLILRVLFLVDH